MSHSGTGPTCRLWAWCACKQRACRQTGTGPKGTGDQQPRLRALGQRPLPGDVVDEPALHLGGRALGPALRRGHACLVSLHRRGWDCMLGGCALLAGQPPRSRATGLSCCQQRAPAPGCRQEVLHRQARPPVLAPRQVLQRGPVVRGGQHAGRQQCVLPVGNLCRVGGVGWAELGGVA